MSTAKRSRARQTGAKAISPSQPAPKRLKTTKDSHVPARSGLDFLVDEDARIGKKLEAKLTNGVPSSKVTRVDDSRAVVAPSQNDISKLGSTQDTALEISSAESSSSDEESEQADDEDVRQPPEPQEAKKILVNGHTAADEDDALSEPNAAAGAERMDTTQDNTDGLQDEEEDIAEPSFRDLLQARHPELIDVRASFPNPMVEKQALIHASGSGPVALPSGTSLVTVLTQALKTNDKAQLETCFQQIDVLTIRSTIQRLQSQHVATLLQRVAERIHKRPGRTGSLLVWIQWSLVAHGAYLATQPDVMAKLRSLSQVLKERASGLQPLLHLKGKLDMLAAQLDMRRSMQAASRARTDAEDEDDEEGVLYVEGLEDDDWSDEAEAGNSMLEGTSRRTIELPPPPSTSSSRKQAQTATRNTDPSGPSDESDDDDDDDDLPNGVIQEADDSSDVEESEEEGMFDVEAEEASEDDEDEDVDSSEAEESELESESEVSDGDESDTSAGVKPLDPAKLNRKR